MDLCIGMLFGLPLNPLEVLAEFVHLGARELLHAGGPVDEVHDITACHRHRALHRHDRVRQRPELSS